MAAMAAAGLFALTPGHAMAHSDGHIDTQAAPHGGQLRTAGSYHLELVVAKDSVEARDNAVIVYLTDHAGAELPTVGAKGTATILFGKTRTSIALMPDGGNRLKGSGRYASTPDMKAIVSVTLAGGATEQARFTPLVRPGASAQDGHSGPMSR
ncbi:MAG: hypothetical protein HYZ20_12910 [Burkholderiales bacterium]|nr:hypothetical protein [Burkholderiales bacterium]